MAFSVFSKKLLVYAFRIAISTESFSLVKVMKLYFGQKRCKLLDIRVILLYQSRVALKSVTNLLILHLAFMILIVTPRYHLVAEEALNFQPLTFIFQMLL